jgi:RHS repeat-associated protein
VTITTTNSAPVADAGPDQPDIVAGSPVMLDGSGSRDPDAHALTFQWALLRAPVGSAATLSNSLSPNPTLVADLEGDYVAQLIVRDPFVPSAPDTVLVSARIVAVNRAPIADAGVDHDVELGATVSLDGSGSSDPDADTITFSWTVAGAPVGSTATLQDPTSVSPTFTPDFAGGYLIQLVVNDGTVDSLADAAMIAVREATGAPSITDFSPTSGRIGRVVTVTGTNFVNLQSVAFNGVPALGVNVIDPTSLTVTVPSEATTGPISVTTLSGNATSTGHFVILSDEDFQLSVEPETITVPSGGLGSFQISISGSEGFANLATLAVTGVPNAATATFAAPRLTSNQSTQLTITTSGVPSGSIPLTVSATAVVNGAETTRSAEVVLEVVGAGLTSVSGQFLTVDEVPIPNVLVQIGSIQAHSDAAGNFVLQNVPEGAQPLMIDANVAVAGYPIYKVDLNVVAGQTLTLPTFRITPPPPPERFTPFNNATQDQIITDSRFPGFELTLPAGARIIGWDGTPKTKAAVERILPNDLPVPAPPGPTNSLYQIHFGTPMGGIPNMRLPVTLPNDQSLDPGQQAEIWWYDAAPVGGGPGEWKFAGMGTVSADGRKVVSNPGVGIDRFCGVCGLVCIIYRQENLENGNLHSPQGADPVDLALGQMTVEKTDLVLPGRLPATIHRTYSPFDPFGGISGFELGLGPGWALSVDVVLLEVSPSLRRLILPGNARLDFPIQPDGSFAEPKDPAFGGAVLTDEAGGIHRLRFKDGRVWRFASTGVFSGVGLLIEETDRNGNSLAIERDVRGVVTRVTEPSGRSLVVFQSGGRIAQVSDPTGRVVRYSYDSSRRLETVIDPAGGTTRYTYDGEGRILTITDAKGIEFIRNEYSPLSGRILRQIQADGSVWELRYRVFPSTGPPPPGQLVNIAAVEESVASIAAGLTGDLRNPPFVTTVVDPRGNATTYGLHLGFANQVTDALGQSTRFERDDRGRTTRVIDPLGRVTRLEYDTRDNVTRIIDPENNATSLEYEPSFSRLTRMTDALGNVTTFEYDAKGNLTAVTDPEQNARPESERLKTRIAYDGFGQPISMTDPLGNETTIAYDDRGSLASVVDPLGNISRIAYDAVSRPIAQTDPRGRTTTFTYDALNLVRKITDAIGGETAFTYDPNGNLLTVTDARQNTVQYEYDEMDRLVRRIDQLGRTETFGYDANGNLKTTTDRKAQTTTFTHDAVDRRVQGQFADGAVATFEYDAAGRLVRADDTADPHRPITLEYDELDRLEVETTLLGSVRYTYDALGRRTEMLASGAPPVTYAYDRNSRLRSVLQEPLAPATFDYDAADRRTRLTLPNGVSTEYQYDPASRLVELIYRNTLGPLGNLTYQYDSAGNRIGVGGSFARTLLPDAVSASDYDAANQQLQFGDRKLTYDGNGNLESIAEPAGATQLTWDARNRLVNLNELAATGSFAYDAFGRRSSRNIDGRFTQYTYDGLDFISETTNGTPLSYLRSLFIDEILVGHGTESYIADALGSSVALTDPGGTIATQYIYEPFGNTATFGTPSDNKVQYTGRENDAAGLYFYRARYYSPALHRFIGEDPLEAGRDIENLYAFVGNGPTARVDPTGLRAITFPQPGVLSLGLPLPTSAEVIAAGGAIAAKVGGLDPFDPCEFFKGSALKFATCETVKELWERARASFFEEANDWALDPYLPEGLKVRRDGSSVLSGRKQPRPRAPQGVLRGVTERNHASGISPLHVIEWNFSGPKTNHGPRTVPWGPPKTWFDGSVW